MSVNSNSLCSCRHENCKEVENLKRYVDGV